MTMYTQSKQGEQETRPTPTSSASATRIQRKMILGSTNDSAEHEADAMANHVMRMPSPALIQRKCAACEEEDTHIHRKADGDGVAVTDAIASRIQQRAGGGSTLPGATRSFMESRFGADFSGVRVHTDNEAHHLSRDLNAQAFTIGNNIYFGAGKYSPETTSGQHLLAHELTHVVQQTGSQPTASNGPVIRRLGANPSCTAAQAGVIHQSIYDARGWVLNALPKLEATPPSAAVLSSLRRNFGPTYGVAANISLIAGRIRTAYSEMATIPYACADATDATCASAPCGYTPVAGGHSAVICSNASLGAGTDHIYQTGCVLHESFHSAFAAFTVDHYSGWHGHSGSSADYPGSGKDPLVNADSYTSLVIDLS